MGEKLLQKINIPLWSLILSIAIIVGGFVINTKVFAAKTEERINRIEKTVDSKADMKDVHYMIQIIDDSKIQLNRIEKKLDDHIAK
jgi:hypothetical protein